MVNPHVGLVSLPRAPAPCPVFARPGTFVHDYLLAAWGTANQAPVPFQGRFGTGAASVSPGSWLRVASASAATAAEPFLGCRRSRGERLGGAARSSAGAPAACFAYTSREYDCVWDATSLVARAAATLERPAPDPADAQLQSGPQRVHVRFAGDEYGYVLAPVVGPSWGLHASPRCCRFESCCPGTTQWTHGGSSCQPLAHRSLSSPDRMAAGHARRTARNVPPHSTPPRPTPKRPPAPKHAGKAPSWSSKAETARYSAATATVETVPTGAVDPMSSTGERAT